MPTHGPDLLRLSVSQLAQLTGKDRRTVRKDLADLEPVGKDGRTVWYAARPALETLYLGETLDLTRERARLAREQADAQELKNATARGELVPAEDVQLALLAVTSPLAAALDGLPTKAAPAVRATSSDREAERVLRGFVDQMRTELADRGAQYRED